MKKLFSLILVLSLVFSLAACGSKPTEPSTPAEPNAPVEPEKPAEPEIKSADLQAFYEKTFVNENMPMMGVMDAEMLDAFYAGLTALELKQCIVAMPMISAVAAEVALVEVANADDLAKVEEIFKARITAQVDGGAFYPATIEVWEKNAEIITHGNTVMMICMDPKDEVVKAFNELFA
jgi:predicted small lipoprotein YifL